MRECTLNFACEGELVCQIKKYFVIPVFKEPLRNLIDYFKNMSCLKHKSIKLKLINTVINFNPNQDGLFWGCSRMGAGGGRGGKKVSLSKICHTYPALMKLGTVIPYLKKIQKRHKSRDIPLHFC